MSDKENQIFDKYRNYNFPTEIKQEGLNNVTSQIEEIQNALPHIEVIKAMYGDIDFAKYLYDHSCRIIAKNNVVLSKEELNEIINQTKETEKNYYKRVVIPQERKETAEKIYKDLRLFLSDETLAIITRYFKEILDVEIKG